MTLLRLCAIVATALLVGATPSPREMFDGTFERLLSYPVPPYAVWWDTWKVHSTSTAGDGRASDSVVAYRYAVRTADGAENSSSFPLNAALPPALVGPQFQGPFGWSMHGERRPHGGGLQPDVPTPLKTIAHVVTFAPPSYAIDLAGVEPVGAAQTYHLRLRPLRDPGVHNLRDLWVDTQTLDLRKAHFNGTYAPSTSEMESPSDVTVYFVPIAQYWVVSRMIWTWNDVHNSTSFLFDATTNNIAFPAALPDWLFDGRAYRRHQDAHEPDYLGPILRGETPGAATPSPQAS